MSRLGDSLQTNLHDWILKGRFDELRRQVTASARGRVLEVGAGTGLNFGFYPPDAEVVAIEPNRPLRERARARSRSADVHAAIEVVDAIAERLPFADEVFDSVVVTFTLCSIELVDEALREIHRVLHPGGAVHLVEHVEAEPRTARWQRRVQPIWTHVFGGCSLTRNPAVELARAGFDAQGLERVDLPLPRLARAGMIGLAHRPPSS